MRFRAPPPPGNRAALWYFCETTIARRTGLRLIFLNRYFHPDISATSQMLSDLAFALAGAGENVHVITSRQRYDDAAARLPARETLNGVQVQHVWTSRFGRTNLAGRALDYLSFYFTASVALARLARAGDVVIAKTDPPLISVPAAWIARRRGALLVNWLQDVFPEVAEQMGLRAAAGAPGALLRRLRGYSLHRAAVSVALGERMARRVRALPGVRHSDVAVIHNWADGEAIVPVNPAANPLRAEWGLEGRFVLAYSGNMGRAHEFDTMLGAAEALRDHAEIVFLFIGGGHYRAWIEAEAKRRSLANVVFQPYQPRERLVFSLGVADAHLTCLRPALEGLVMPSKLYAILASGRPTLHVGDTQGEVAGILDAARAGFAVASGDAAGLAARIRELAAAPALRAELGRNARTVFDAHFSQPIAIGHWKQLLAEIQKAAARNKT